MVVKEKIQGRCKAEGSREEGEAGEKIKRGVFGGWGDVLVRTQSDCTVKHVSQGARITTQRAAARLGLLIICQQSVLPFQLLVFSSPFHFPCWSLARSLELMLQQGL